MKILSHYIDYRLLCHHNIIVFDIILRNERIAEFTIFNRIAEECASTAFYLILCKEYIKYSARLLRRVQKISTAPYSVDLCWTRYIPSMNMWHRGNPGRNVVSTS